MDYGSYCPNAMLHVWQSESRVYFLSITACVYYTALHSWSCEASMILNLSCRALLVYNECRCILNRTCVVYNYMSLIRMYYNDGCWMLWLYCCQLSWVYNSNCIAKLRKYVPHAYMLVTCDNVHQQHVLAHIYQTMHVLRQSHMCMYFA